MVTTSHYLVDTTGLSFEEKDGVVSSWIHALGIGSYKHPVYGTIDVTTDRVKNFMDNVKNKIRGTVDPSINYVHNNADEAAGWVKDADTRSDGLWLLVEWVKDAAQSIKDKKWRYFSAELVDEWEDPQGTKHKDVILGGALTNRPFMKNLVPLNLSETTIDLAFDLVTAITGKDKDSLKGGNDVALSEEEITKIVTQLAEKIGPQKPADPPTPTATPSLMEMPEIKALAEENPIVKGLVEIVEKQQQQLKGSATNLKEAAIAAKLSEFDKTKIVLTPTAKELTAKLAMQMSEESQTDFFKLLGEMKKGSSFLVELGERAGATVNYGLSKTAVQEFTELAASIKGEKKCSDADSYELAAAQNPALFRRYRTELATSEVK